MSKHRLFLLIATIFIIAAVIPSNSGDFFTYLIPGRNVNMVEGTTLPGGDPYLQRQNEPSIAVSTRNPLHLLAGANDYRTVDIPILNEQLPGNEYIAAGDAWLGVFKSYDGGQSWTSSLLPGFPQEEGSISPLWGLQAAADPTVRAGTNGMFYYSGLAFDRVENGRSVIFVARFIDNNNEESGDSIQHIDTTIIDEGTSGQFEDKPWLAVDFPREGAQYATIPVQNNSDPDDPNSQIIPCGNVYLVYSVFLGELDGQVHSRIMFARSLDCGTTWEKPIKLSESQHVNQGTTLAVDPVTGAIYVAWRRFASSSESHAIMMCKSDDFGWKFTKAIKVADIDPFDQGTSSVSFRTNSFPSIAVDENSIVYLAWAERKVPDGDARIYIATAQNGTDWSSATPIEDHEAGGHQIMPTLTYANGRLMASWIDLREDACGQFTKYIDEVWEIRHTIDIRAAQALPGTPPQFEPSVQVSRYLYALKDSNGTPVLQQVQFNPPNYPLFKLGTVPFMGDYIDITPSPMFVPNGEGWSFNTAETSTASFHVTWTDNRDVRPPADFNWTVYAPPESADCLGDRAGMRNQNIYTSHLNSGLVLGSPGNSKSLLTEAGDPVERTFVVFLKNTTNVPRSFLMEIVEPPSGVRASFSRDGSIVDELEVKVPSFSSISRPVYVQLTEPDPGLANASIIVNVYEMDELTKYNGGNIIEGGLGGTVILNPDPTNPDIDNPDIDNPEIDNPDIDNAEVHNPEIDNATVISMDASLFNIINPEIDNAGLLNPALVTPDIDNPEIDNHNLVNPEIDNPEIDNENIVNPDIDNPTIPSINPLDGSVTDVQWTVTNNGNTTSSYTFKSIAPESLPEGLFAQLIIYRIHYTPSANITGYNDGCTLNQIAHHELLVNITPADIIAPDIDNPDIDNLEIENPEIDNPDIENATFFLAPEEEALVTLRLINPGTTSSSPTVTSSRKTLSNGDDFDPVDYGESLGGATIAQAPNYDGTTAVGKTDLKILTLSLPDGKVGVDYSAVVNAFGGEGSHAWSYSGALPPGLILDSVTGDIAGVPEFQDHISYPYTYYFTVDVSDQGDPIQSDSKELNITVHAPTVQFSSMSSEAYEYTTNVDIEVSLSEEWEADVTVDYAVAGGSATAVFDYVLESGIAIISAGNLSTNISLEVIQDNLYELDETVSVLLSNPHNANLGGNWIHTHTILDDDDKPFISFESTTSGEEESSSPAQLKLVLTNILGESIFSGLDAEVDYTVTGGTAFGGGTDYTLTAGTAVIPASSNFTYIEIDIHDEDLYEYDETIEVTLSNPSLDTVLGTPTLHTYTIVNDDDPPLIGFNSVSSSGYESVDSVDLQLTLSEISGVPATVQYAAAGGTAGGNGEDFVLEDGTATIPAGDLTTEIKIIIVDDQLDEPDETIIVELSAASDATIGENSSYTYTILDDDVVIAGKVTVIDYPLEGVTISGLPVEPVTDENGEYMDIVTLGWSGTATPVMPGYGFSPDSSVYTGIVTNLIQEDYAVLPKEEEWVARYNNSPVNGMDEATAIAVDSMGGYIYVTGYSTGKTSGADIFTIKYDSSGTKLWEARFDGPSHLGDYATAIAVDQSGNVYVTGYIYRGNVVKHSDYCTLKYDTDGNLLWDASYDARRNGNDVPTAIAADPAGNVYVTGRSEYSLSKKEEVSYDYYTVKYNSSGIVQWEARYEGPVSGDDEATAIALDSSAVYVTGRSTGSENNFDCYTTKYDINDGNILWESRYDGGGIDEAVSIAVDSTGAYVTGRSDGAGNNFDYYTAKYDINSGVKLWEVVYDAENGNDGASDIAVDSIGVYVTGRSTGSGNNFDYYTARYNPVDGSEIWSIRYDGGDNDEAKAMTLDATGLYVTGASFGKGTNLDYSTFKYDTNYGFVLWFARYNNAPVNGDDKAYAIVVDSGGNVYVTGTSVGSGTANDYATVKYKQLFE